MFNIFRKYKKLKEEYNKLLLENSNLTLELDKYNKVDRVLNGIVNKKVDLSKLDLSNIGRVKEASSQAISALSNPILRHILNNGKYDMIMGIATESRDYLEVVQKRGNLLYIENTIIKGLKDIADMKNQVNDNGKDTDDFSFLNDDYKQ
jgi:hypothetical protein